MKRTATLSLLIALLLALCVSGCRGRSGSSTTATAPTTQTIAPADGKPAVNGGDAVTQTVDVEDGRSEDDGGVLTNPQPAKKPGAAKAPAKPPRKKN